MRSSLILAVALALSACKSKPKDIDAAVQPAVAPVAPKTAAPSPTAAPVVSPDAMATCDKGKDHRVLEVRTKDKGAELVYTKNGQAAVVSSSGHGTSHCEHALKKIRGKLEAAGFTCK